MDDFTRKFSIVDEKDAEIRHILTTVYRALEENGLPTCIYWQTGFPFPGNCTGITG